MQHEYKKIKQLSPAAWLVQLQNGSQAVLKQLPASMQPVYEILQQERFAGIPAIYELEPASDGLLVLEEYIPGPDLLNRLAQQEFDHRQILQVMDQLCAILKPIHTAKLVHRDIKPEHIIFAPQGLRLIDFGIARVADPSNRQDTQLLGTPGYAAPEQYGFGSSDAQTDIYALGKVLADMDDQGQFARQAAKAQALSKKERYPDVTALQRDLHNKRFIIPGINNDTLIGKIISWLYLALSLYLAWNNADTNNGVMKSNFIYQLTTFLYLYGLLFFAQNTRLFSRLPGGRLLPVRILYAAVSFILYIVAITLIFSLLDLAIG